MNSLPFRTNKYIEKFKTIIKLGKLLFTPIAAIFLLTITWQSRNTISQVFTEAKIEYLIFAIIGWSLLYVFYPATLVVLSKDWKNKINFKDAFYIFIHRLPARYIPGGIWHSVARYTDFSKLGLNKRQLASIFFFENILALVIAILIGGSILFLYQSETSLQLILGGSVFIAAVLLISLLYIVNHYILNNRHSIRITSYITAIVIVTTYWLLAASIFALYLYALLGYEGINQFILFCGTYLFSWGAGYLAFFAPQGLGVFELVANYFLNINIGALGTVTIIAGHRVIVLLADLLVWMLFRIWSFSSEKHS